MTGISTLFPESGASNGDTKSLRVSQDFEVAIEEGTTQVRLGTAIFGERSK